MRWRIVAVGKPKLAHARAGIAEYLARMRCFSTVEVEHVKASNPAQEGELLLHKSKDCFRLVLDEHGRLFTSRHFADAVKKIELNPRKTCAILVGGADGLTEPVRQAADLLWSLSPLTLQHEMALAFALEQIYRAHTILAGVPYHRD
ncbi:MAG: 23S rRNA (pseudouridine(1915)-N(3))-methyltransferase RlmH [Verrucomicrobiota bacterium]